MKLSRSTQAAYWLRDHPGETLRNAAGQFGITHQAVQQAWTALELGPTPRLLRQEARRDQVLALARSGKTCSEIATATGASKSAVHTWCAKAGVDLAPAIFCDEAKLATAVEYVQHGGTISQAALMIGYTHGAFARILSQRGASPGRRGMPRGGRHGLSKLASNLVDREGINICAAAARVGVSPGSVRKFRAYRGLSL